MLRSVKNIFWLLATVVGAQSAFGFTLIGPPDSTGTSDAYQIAQIGYNVLVGFNPDNVEDGTPKTIHEGYRRNTPVVYYAFDDSFRDYFSDNGIAELDKAFAMYNSVGKVSQLDPNDYPEDSRRPNFRAQAVGLYDLKSFVMGLMTTQVGLFQPSRWVWALTEREQLPPPPGAPGCPFNMEYTIQHLDYDLSPGTTATYPTTSYVNGVLYSYYIAEFCGGPNPIADAVEFPVDPLSSPYSAVADFRSLDYVGLLPGVFYTSLTRDDVTGMQYIYATNNFGLEAAGNRTTEFLTNNVAQTILTQDLGALDAAAKVNDPLTLQGLFPGLIITSTSNYFGFQITTNITQALVNSPFDPAGLAPSHPVFSTNYTTNIVTFFAHTFGNVVTNTYGTRGIVGVITIGISNSPFAPAGSIPTTNTIIKATPVSGVFGDFFILPTNTCAAQIISNMLTTVTPVTNLPVQAPGPTTNSVTFTPGIVNFLTNHTVLYLPVNCPVDSVGKRGGVDRIQFVRRDYDTLSGRSWDPVTNDYTSLEVNLTNGAVSLRHFQRRVPMPDILFSTGNFSSQTSVLTYSNTVDNVTDTFTYTIGVVQGALPEVQRANFYDATAHTGTEAGPGTIITDPAFPALPNLFILNRQFPAFENFSAIDGTTNSFIFTTESQQLTNVAWGSFDGTTNAPVVYPSTVSLEQLENLLLGPASATPSLPTGNTGAPYSVQLAAKGGTAPYTWALSPTSPGLPAGLNISSSGKITGTPTGQAAIYDFTVRITDSLGKFRDVQYTITIF